jgi:hypothetical protein
VEDHADLLERPPSDGELAAIALTGALLEEEYREHHRTTRIENGDRGGMSPWRASGWPWRR